MFGPGALGALSERLRRGVGALRFEFVLLLAGCSGLVADRAALPEPSTAAIQPLRLERPVIALALGSGGSRGFAHVGVIKALEAAGVERRAIAGVAERWRPWRGYATLHLWASLGG